MQEDEEEEGDAGVVEGERAERGWEVRFGDRGGFLGNGGLWRLGGGELLDCVFQADPAHEKSGEGEVEEALVGDSQNDKSGGKGEEDDEDPVHVVVVGLQTVGQRHEKRRNYYRAWVSEKSSAAEHC